MSDGFDPITGAATTLQDSKTTSAPLDRSAESLYVYCHLLRVWGESDGLLPFDIVTSGSERVAMPMVERAGYADDEPAPTLITD